MYWMILHWGCPKHPTYIDHVLYDFSGKGLKILQGGYVTLLVEIKLPVHHLKAFLG
ncbi:hypothetical protein BSPWISOXPB_3438 [uncultured Gammaproteobacteria bacterium]|nr:hypothetical protein BSPWISOXPB_3438 [uncultured Gammaproteobacteria bacterium]